MQSQLLKQHGGGTTASNGKYLNIYATGDTIQQYKPNFFTLSTIFNIQNSSYNGFSFIDATYDGLYEIEISLLFKNTSSNVEFMPLIQISKTTTGTETIQHAMVATINHTHVSMLLCHVVQQYKSQLMI